MGQRNNGAGERSCSLRVARPLTERDLPAGYSEALLTLKELYPRGCGTACLVWRWKALCEYIRVSGPGGSSGPDLLAAVLLFDWFPGACPDCAFGRMFLKTVEAERAQDRVGFAGDDFFCK